ncbi:two component response regulator [Psychrobacter sp. JCM 18903]|uniref:response regulator transcription factor n=1 Tax=Psychrobacter sp. JCM 18903 TaxID=1298610 RepID=UPI000433F075|nr:response regulator [Psychrobacter sp. JCM 18903]GAF62554.1 two component response regulator [Psychrobacter sp. JCM 18903]
MTSNQLSNESTCCQDKSSHLSDDSSGITPESLIIHIIDDEESVRMSCGFLISSLGLSTQVWASALTFLQQVNIYRPAVIVSDLMMPEMSGQALQVHLSQQDSSMALIALTGNGEIADAVNMLKQGAADYLEKPINSRRLQEALACAQDLTLKRATLYDIKKLYAQLTDKEKQVANELLEGNLNKNIADHLDVSVRTVEVHRSQVMKKMQSQHVSELIQKLVLLDA